MSERTCRISYAFLLDGQIAISAFETTFPPKIENNADFIDTIVSRVMKNMMDNNLSECDCDNIKILGWSFYD